MALNRGTHLGTYEILGQIGAGGMREVYRAKGQRLGRGGHGDPRWCAFMKKLGFAP